MTGGEDHKPRTDDGITVVGGAGGTRACLIALITGAVRAERAAQHLAEAAVHAARAVVLVAQTADLSPATAPQARTSAAALVTGPLGLHRRSERLLELAAGLRGAAEAYARADQDSASLLRAVAVSAGRSLGELGPGAVLLVGTVALGGVVWVSEAATTARLLRYAPTPLGAALRWLGNDDHRADDGLLGVVARLVGGRGLLPELTFADPREMEAALPVLAAVLAGLAPGRASSSGDSVSQAAALIATVSRGGVELLGTPLPGLVVAPLALQKGTAGKCKDVAPQSVADVLREVDRVSSDVHGAVGVQRIDHVDGTRSWVVTIPGTQDTGVGGPTTTDMLTNLELIGGLPDDRTEMVLQAMQQSGIRPGEPVLLAGHSQGGMVAVRVAASAGDTFTIAGVVTAGSPVGGMALPDDIPALHLEHAQDYVPSTDGTPNPDTPSRTTVTRDLSVGGDWPTSGSMGDVLHGVFSDPHDLGEYVTTAELATQHGDRSVQAFLDAVAPVLDDGTAEVATVRYVGVRVPDDAGLVGATSSSGKPR